MSGIRMFLNNNVVVFSATEIAPEGPIDCAANDNCCPHCGGVLEPGDKPSDCSGAWSFVRFPKGWEASC